MVDPDGLQPLITKIHNAIGRDNLNAVRDFAAGLTSGLTAGLSNYALDAFGDAGRKDRCSDLHTAGEWTGALADLALGGKSLLKNLAEVGFGPLKQWIRVGKSYSRNLDEPISLSLRWGASPAKGGKYLKQIPNPTLRSFNQQLRSKRIPFGGWRAKDPGHFHIYK
jgi:hypothetical protein